MAARRRTSTTILALATIVAVTFGMSGVAAAASVSGNVLPRTDVLAPGTVGVVASGAPVQGVVPVVVQNASGVPVNRLQVEAWALDSDGQILARAKSRRVLPETIEPQALGLARVDFDDPLLPLSVRYAFDVTEASTNDTTKKKKKQKKQKKQKKTERQQVGVSLEPTGFQLSPPTVGPVAQTLDVTLRNPTETRVNGPLRVGVMCFGESRLPVQFVETKTRTQRIAPGDSVNATVKFEELCPAYLVGATAIRRG